MCSSPDWALKILKETGFVAHNINIALGEALTKYPESHRSQKADAEIMRIASGFSTPVLLEDYQILFDPRYQIDPIKAFCQIARRQRVVVRWDGRLKNNSLEYAEPGYPDFRTFAINSYDIVCGLPPIFVPTCELVKTVRWHPHSFLGLATS